MTPLHRRYVALALLACLAQCQSTHAQLTDPPKSPELVLPAETVAVGSLFDVSVLADVPAGVKAALNWKINGKPADAKHLRISADGISAVGALPPGTHEIAVFGAWGVVGENDQVNITLIDLQGEIVVGAPGPPVPPDNPDPPKPPTPGTLGALVPDPAHRALLAEFYADIAAATRAGAFQSIGHFRAAQQKAIADLKAAGRLPTTLSAINEPISARLVAAVGLDDAPLDDAKKAALAAALDSIAAEFK